jgi:hypothetical protein
MISGVAPAKVNGGTEGGSAAFAAARGKRA